MTARQPKKASCAIIWVCILALIPKVDAAHNLQVPAFPGAEGYGSVTRGDGAGNVTTVTNLDDARPGNSREVGETEGLRQRVVASTDIGGTDQDDLQSMVHRLVYAD